MADLIAKYRKLKLLKKTIEVFQIENIEEISEKYSTFQQDLTKTINKIKEKCDSLRIYKKCKTYYYQITKIISNELIEDFKKLLKEKKIIQIIKHYHKIEIYIINNIEKLNLSYNNERKLVQNMIHILYSGGSYRINPFFEMWNTLKGIKDEKTWIKNQREEFRKLFCYYFWDQAKQKYYVSSLNVKDVRKPFDFLTNTPNKKLLIESKIIRLTKKISKAFGTKPIDEKNHIYLSITIFGKNNRIYVGKAKNNTRRRWGYSSGHLFEVFHYIVRGGDYYLPKQLTDLWTLYFGPGRQVVTTLMTDVEKINDYEKAMQYFLEFEKARYNIDGYMHEQLSHKSVAKLPDNIKNAYVEIKNAALII